jgi:hypothetical protein
MMQWWRGCSHRGLPTKGVRVGRGTSTRSLARHYGGVVLTGLRIVMEKPCFAFSASLRVFAAEYPGVTLLRLRVQLSHWEL